MLSHLALSTLFLSTASALLPWPKGFTRYIWASSTVIGSNLYIDGGELYTGEYEFATLASTLVIDLGPPWTTSSVTAIAYDKPQAYPYARQPWTWNVAGGILSSVGGWSYADGQGWFAEANKYGSTTVDSPALWQFDQTKFNWTISSQQPPSTIHYNPGSLRASSQRKAFALGGATVSDPSSNSAALAWQGMAVQDLITQQWQNVSSAAYGSSGFGAFGDAVFAPNYGSQGVIIFLGGYTPSQHTFTWSADTVDTLQDMSKVIVFDINSQTFFDQPTNGSPPNSRWGFCAVGAEDANGGGFDIFIHGGFAAGQSSTTTQYASGMDDIWVLSLPSFQWIQVSNSSQSPRALHTCEVIGNDQMIVVGGADPTSTTENGSLGGSTDPWPSAIGLFDMSLLKWITSYVPTANLYQRSSAVVKAIGNSTYPSTSSNAGLTIFAQGSTLAPSSTFSTTSSPTSTSNTNTNTQNSSSSGPPVGGIVGGIVGFVLVCAAIPLLIFWRIRRRRRHRRQSSHDDLTGKPELPGTPVYTADAKTGVVSAAPREMDAEWPLKELDARSLPVELGAEPSELDAGPVLRPPQRWPASRVVHELHTPPG